MARLRPVGFEDRLTVVEHLDELRTRIIVVLLAFGVALGLCFWQSEVLIAIANRPLPGGMEPVTFSVAEPFMTTVTLAAYGAIVLSFPVVLYQAYSYLLPALTPSERRVVIPVVLMAPVLFGSGVVFAYFVIAPIAVEFLLGFNATEFDVQVRARDYYGFVGFTHLSMGVLFQIPLGVLAVTRLGLVTPDQLAANRRYAILVIAVIAMLLPGPDPVTMLLAMAPLVALYELAILLARAFSSPDRVPGDADLSAGQPH